MKPSWSVLVGDVREKLRECADDHFQCVITSPPYWGLRDYGVEGQIGLEENPEAFIEVLVEVFREVRRVMRPDGTLFLNMGDCYYSGERDALPLRDVDASWLAALIDGEGCIQVHRQNLKGSAPAYQVDVSVGQIDEGMVRRAHAITGVGTVVLQRRGVFDWSVRGQQAADLLAAIYPFLVLKKDRAAIACMVADDLRARKFGRGNPATADALEFREAARQAIKSLNQRTSTDFKIRHPVRRGPFKPKDLVGQPWMLAFALRDEVGLYLRAENIWHKRSVMPESCTDRTTRCHEQVFMFSKEPSYFYDADAVREEDAGNDHARTRVEEQETAVPGASNHKGIRAAAGRNGFGRNKRSVWTLGPEPSSEPHFAVFPTKLVEPCLLAGTSERGACPSCGSPWKRVKEAAKGGSIGKSWHDHAADTETGNFKTESSEGYQPARTVGWAQSCECEPHEPIPCAVLDPFSGMATTGVVAIKHGRSYCGIELNPKYAEISRRLLHGAVEEFGVPLFEKPVPTIQEAPAKPREATASLFADMGEAS